MNNVAKRVTRKSAEGKRDKQRERRKDRMGQGMLLSVQKHDQTVKEQGARKRAEASGQAGRLACISNPSKTTVRWEEREGKKEA